MGWLKKIKKWKPGKTLVKAAGLVPGIGAAVKTVAGIVDAAKQRGASSAEAAQQAAQAIASAPTDYGAPPPGGGAFNLKRAGPWIAVAGGVLIVGLLFLRSRR